MVQLSCQQKRCGINEEYILCKFQAWVKMSPPCLRNMKKSNAMHGLQEEDVALYSCGM